MSIRDILEKIKRGVISDRFFWVSLILLVGATSFSLGRLSTQTGTAKGKVPISIQKVPMQASIELASSSMNMRVEATTTAPHTTSVPKAKATETGAYVASKGGKKYHLPWCSGAKRISDENKVWFKDKASAEAAGYTPASNCPGI